MKPEMRQPCSFAAPAVRHGVIGTRIRKLSHFTKIFPSTCVTIARKGTRARLNTCSPPRHHRFIIMKFLPVVLALALAALPQLSRSETIVATPVPSTEAGSEVPFPLLPALLENALGEKIASASLHGKTVALYFSAHWCPPCRAFTPSLVEFHKAHAAENFEIVFVSLDKSSGERATYIREVAMPWLMVAGARSKDGQALADHFGVRGIPALIVLRPDGSLVTKDGRVDVTRDPAGALTVWQAALPATN